MATHLPGLDQHFSLPRITHVGASKPVQWLRHGWQDFMAHPGPSLVYGVIVAIAGLLIVAIAAPRPYLVTAAVSGFMLVAPLVAAGIYELTRQREAGRKPTFLDSIAGLKASAGTLGQFGVMLAIVAILWERLSAILLALLYGGEMTSVEGFVRQMFLSGQYNGVLAAWMFCGFILASCVFAFTAVGMPMVVDRDVDMISAMMASLRTVVDNLPAMIVWAALIVALTLIGFATMMIGMVVIMPLLGHATWCAYRDLVEP
ncbi:DUF2189 domain-containing protein [Chitinivorax sp. PXF-14]|uniref:DUF2189 domain-containing protein n=1 Tax=Chitinivorax sp. PXF-14 TaxID=3230488 RepID=UPI0034677928